MEGLFLVSLLWHIFAAVWAHFGCVGNMPSGVGLQMAHSVVCGWESQREQLMHLHPVHVGWCQGWNFYP